MNLREDLKAYVDGELTEARQNEIEQALAQDDEMEKQFQDFQVLSSAIQDNAKQYQSVGMEKALARTQKNLTGRRIVELLVVCGVVMVLAAVCFPVFAQAKSASKKTAWISQQKQERMKAEMGRQDGVPAETQLLVRDEANPVVTVGHGAQNGAGWGAYRNDVHGRVDPTLHTPTYGGKDEFEGGEGYSKPYAIVVDAPKVASGSVDARNDSPPPPLGSSGKRRSLSRRRASKSRSSASPTPSPRSPPS